MQLSLSRLKNPAAQGMAPPIVNRTVQNERPVVERRIGCYNTTRMKAWKRGLHSLNPPQPSIQLHRRHPQIRLQWLSFNDLANTRATDIRELQLPSEVLCGNGDNSGHSKFGRLEWQTSYRGPEPDMEGNLGVGVDGFEEFQGVHTISPLYSKKRVETMETMETMEGVYVGSFTPKPKCFRGVH
jgi:hypothetical protein